MRKDEAAFPQPGYGQWEPLPGMTLRDYFAAKALCAMLSNPGAIEAAAESCVDDDEVITVLSAKAYAIAGSMLAAREVSK